LTISRAAVGVSHAQLNRYGLRAWRKAIFAARIAATDPSNPQSPPSASPSVTAAIETRASTTSTWAVTTNSRRARRTAIRKLSYRLRRVRPATATRPHVHSVASGSCPTTDVRSQAHASRPRA
jgi:hypothetical protein